MSTKVWLNYFDASYRSAQCTSSSLYLKRIYSQKELKKRKSPSKMKLFADSSPPPPKITPIIKRDGSSNVNIAFVVEQHGNHIYEVEEKALTSRCTPVIACNIALS